MIQRD